MTSALELEGKLDYSKAINLQAPDLVKMFPLSAIFESLRFRVDGERLTKDKVDLAVGITISDLKKDFSLHLRNGVMEFAEAKPAKADVQISLSSATLGKILTLSENGDKHSPAMTAPKDKLLDAVEKKDVKLSKGNRKKLEKFFSYFDAPATEKFPITIK